MDGSLFVVVQVAWLLAIQLIAGRLLVAALFAANLLAAPRRRRRWTRWLDASRTLHAAFFPALGAAVTVAVVFHLVPLIRLPAPEPLPFGFPGLGTAAGGLATAGLWTLRAAGRREAAGRLRPARRLARPAGLLVATGAGSLGLGRIAQTTLAGPGPDGFDLAGALLAGCVAGSGLLAGLSGKPRPGDLLGAALWIAALVAFLASESAFGALLR